MASKKDVLTPELLATLERFLKLQEWKWFECGDCRNYHNMYMVKPELWAKHGNGRKVLCVHCFERRLGRPLQKRDFTDAPVNRDLMFFVEMGRRSPS